jgi:hypothetical protein
MLEGRCGSAGRAAHSLAGNCGSALRTCAHPPVREAAMGSQPKRTPSMTHAGAPDRIPGWASLMFR